MKFIRLLMFATVRIGDRLSFHRRTRRIFIPNSDGHARRPGGHRIPRQTMVRKAIDRDWLRLRTSDQAPPPSANHTAVTAADHKSQA
jgi:hypothetical protein